MSDHMVICTGLRFQKKLVVKFRILCGDLRVAPRLTGCIFVDKTTEQRIDIGPKNSGLKGKF